MDNAQFQAEVLRVFEECDSDKKQKEKKGWKKSLLILVLPKL